MKVSPRLIGAIALVTVAALTLTACSGSNDTKKATTPSTPATTSTPAPAAAAPAQGKLLIVADMVNGSANVSKEDAAAGKSCVETSRYLHNQQVVWRIKVVDGATGATLDDKGLTSVEVALNDGQKFKGKFGAHPKGTPTDNFWATSWTIPENYPSGSVPYTINVVAADGRKAQVVNFNVAISSLIVVDGKVPKITQ